MNDPNLGEGNSVAYMLLTDSVRAAIRRTAVSSVSVYVCRWYKISVSLASDHFLIYVNGIPNPSHNQTNKLQFTDDAGQSAVSKNIDLAAEYLQRDLDKLARWCAKWRIKLNPEKN